MSDECWQKDLENSPPFVREFIGLLNDMMSKTIKYNSLVERLGQPAVDALMGGRAGVFRTHYRATPLNENDTASHALERLDKPAKQGEE